MAYFSAEFGMHESVPIYSGGLGVLSGDHIKSASGLGIPLVAIGLFYDQGYFKQHLDVEGYQHEEYLDTKVENVPMEPARDPERPARHRARSTPAPGHLLAKVWLMRVGRVKLYLLDCDVDGNSPEDRELTSRLYGGDHRTRIRQELVLGVGGVRALAALGITPGVYHLNEGHSVFATLEAIRERMRRTTACRSTTPARGGPAHRLHDAHAGAGRPRPLRRRPDRRALRPAARSVGHFASSN